MAAVGAEKDDLPVVERRAVRANMAASPMWTTRVVNEKRERSKPGCIRILSLGDEVWTDHEGRAQGPVGGVVPEMGAASEIRVVLASVQRRRVDLLRKLCSGSRGEWDRGV